MKNNSTSEVILLGNHDRPTTGSLGSLTSNNAPEVVSIFSQKLSPFPRESLINGFCEPGASESLYVYCK